jgi:hypothetical protein
VTALRDWECLYRGKAKRLDRRKEPVGPALHEGRIIHDVAAEYVLHCCQEQVQTDITAIEGIAHRVFFDPESDEPHSLPAERIFQIAALVRRWAEITPVDWRHTAAVEEIWAPPVRSLTPAPYFYAILDHLELRDDYAVIRDLKSDRHLRTLADVQEDLQLWSYCWAAKQQFPFLSGFEVQMDYLRHGVVRRVEFGPEIVERAEQVIAERITQIRGFRERKQFPAIACDQCTYCGFQSECPILRAQTDPTVIAGPEDAEAAAAALHVLEARRKSLRAILADYTSQAGDVAVGSVAYGHHLRRSETIDEVAEAVDRLEKLGRGAEAWDALRFDRQKLARILRDDQCCTAIADLVVDCSNTEFDARKVEPAEEEETA